MKHYSNTNNPIDFPNIKAGADIHAGDGGYSEGTQEAYDEFVKKRNYQLICPKCGADRLRVDCPNINRLDCGIKMEAQ